MAGFTNRGKACIISSYFASGTAGATYKNPTAFKIALVTDAVTPTSGTNVLSDLTEITAGNGYTTGGQSIYRSTSSWDTHLEFDAGDNGSGSLQVKDLSWTASGGSIPDSGDGARYAVLLDDAATPNVIAWWDLGSARSVSDGQIITIQNAEVRFTES